MPPTVAPLRLAFVLGRYPLVSETFVDGEARALRELGHRVRVEAVDHAGRRDPEATYRSEDGGATRLRALLWLVARHPWRSLRDVADRRRWLREEWAPPLRELAPLARRVAVQRDEHLHAHFAAGAALDALRVSRLLGLPFSVTAHAYDIFQSPANLREKLEAAAVAFTVCDYNARHLRTVAPGARLEVVVLGVDVGRFRRSAPLPAGRTVLGVGRLVEKKGFDVLVAAAELLPGVRVRIAGDGPLRGQLEGRGVELLGERSHDEVRRLLEEADVLAMPCVVAPDGDRDSMPVVVKEAMAMEVLVAASDEVGLPECVAAPWGRLTAPGDARALAAAITELLALAPDDRAEAGRAGRAWVAEHADLRRESAKVAAAIAAALGR